MEQPYGFFEPPKDDSKPQIPSRRAPALGALDGVRKDIQAAKDAGVAYDPRGAGAAWNHKQVGAVAAGAGGLLVLHCGRRRAGGGRAGGRWRATSGAW